MEACSSTRMRSASIAGQALHESCNAALVLRTFVKMLLTGLGLQCVFCHFALQPGGCSQDARSRVSCCRSSASAWVLPKVAGAGSLLGPWRRFSYIRY